MPKQLEPKYVRTTQDRNLPTVAQQPAVRVVDNQAAGTLAQSLRNSTAQVNATKRK
jgi:hypothetical protein